MQRQKKNKLYFFFTTSAGTSRVWLKVPSRRKEHMALSDIAQILSNKKESTWLSPTWLRYQAKKQREPGPNRYRATKFKVSQLTVKRAKSKIQTSSTKRLSNSYVCTILCATYKGKFTKIGYFLLEDTIFKTEANMFPLLFKVGFVRLQFLVKLCKELSL